MVEIVDKEKRDDDIARRRSDQLSWHGCLSTHDYKLSFGIGIVTYGREGLTNGRAERIVMAENILVDIMSGFELLTDKQM